MRKIRPLREKEKAALESGYKTDKRHYFRQRCRVILLSSADYSVAEIAKLLNKKKDTIYICLGRYESNGIQGLENKPGRGIKARLDAITPSQVKELEKTVEKEAQNLNKVAALLSLRWGFKITKRMLIRYLKKNSNIAGVESGNG